MNKFNSTTGLYNNSATYTNTGLIQGDLVDLQIFDFTNMYNGSGYLYVVQDVQYTTDGYPIIPQDDTVKQIPLSSSYINADQAEIDINIQFHGQAAPVEIPALFPLLTIYQTYDKPDNDPNKNFNNFQIFSEDPEHTYTIYATGNIQNILGLHTKLQTNSAGQVVLMNKSTTIQRNGFINLEVFNSLNIQYVQLQCPQLDGAVILEGQYYQGGVIHIMFPQYETSYGNKSRAMSFKMIRNGDLTFNMIDQNSRPVCITPFHVQIVCHKIHEMSAEEFRNFNDSAEKHDKKLCFILSKGQKVFTQTFYEQYQAIGVEYIQALFNPQGNTVYGSIINVYANVMTDGAFTQDTADSDTLIGTLTGYSNYTSSQQVSQFVWRAFQGNHLHIQVDQLLLQVDDSTLDYLSVNDPSQKYADVVKDQNVNLLIKLYLKPV